MLLVISDIHDRTQNLQKLLQYAINKHPDLNFIVALGDYISPGIPLTIAETGLPVIAVLGNNDGDPLTMYQRLQSKGFSNFKLIPRTFYDFEYQNRKIFITHYPEIGRLAAKSQEYDAVFYGHNHLSSVELVNKTVLCNPGEVAGTKTKTVSYALYDPQENKCIIIKV